MRLIANALLLNLLFARAVGVKMIQQRKRGSSVLMALHALKNYGVPYLRPERLKVETEIIHSRTFIKVPTYD